MSENNGIPPNWYKYDFPLKEIEKAPTPSNADYSPRNVAWLMEMFASVISYDYTKIGFIYENNSPINRTDDILVAHPGDDIYYYKYQEEHKEKSLDMLRYEEAAKRSVRLKMFQDNSPAKIEYFT